MLCPHCGQSLAEGSQFCHNCGRALTSQTSEGGTVVCPSCGRAISATLQFCNYCGAPVGLAASVGGVPGKRRVPCWGWALIGCVSLVVLGITGLVVAYISLRPYMPKMGRFYYSQTRLALTNMRNAVKAFHADCGAYPSALADLPATMPPKNGLVAQEGKVVTVPIKRESWHGPYLQPQVPGTGIRSQIPALPHNLITKGNREGRDWSYEKKDPAKLGHIGMGYAAIGKDVNGTPYSEW